MRISSNDHGGQGDSQRKLALKAMNAARNRDRSYTGGSFSDEYKPEIINVLQHKRFSTADLLEISIINSRHALHEMLWRISAYKKDLDLQEEINGMELGDIITIRNELNACEQQILVFLDTLGEADKVKINSEEQRIALNETYKTFIDSIDMMLHTIYDKYEPLLQKAEFIWPLS